MTVLVHLRSLGTSPKDHMVTMHVVNTRESKARCTLQEQKASLMNDRMVPLHVEDNAWNTEVHGRYGKVRGLSRLAPTLGGKHEHDIASYPSGDKNRWLSCRTIHCGV